MSQSPLVRSSSRSKRSTTNLANLRLAPLSAKYAEQPHDRHAPKSPYEEAAEATLAKYTYRQGRSAPTTPGLAPSRQRHSHAGLSRRESVYDDNDDDDDHYRKADRDHSFGDPIIKSLTEAEIRTPGQSFTQTKKGGHKRSRTAGTNTPRSKSKSRADDDWLSHTGATANALLLESKGSTWLQSRPSSTNLVIANSDDDDEGYEEMAALSATTTRASDFEAVDGQKTPRQDRWGSRFGSRPASRHASRRGSMAAGIRTPTAGLSEGVRGYFERESQQSAAFVQESSEDETDDDDEHLMELTKDRSFGLGPYVDRVMASIFNLPDVDESGTETGNEAETAAEAKARRLREAVRRQQEKDNLVAPPAPEDGKDGGKVGAWQDASWLLGVAGRVLG